MADCVACGQVLVPGGRFCRHCGVGVADADALASFAPSSAHEERTDVLGSTAPHASDPPAEPPTAHPRRWRWRLVAGALLVAVAGGLLALDRSGGGSSPATPRLGGSASPATPVPAATIQFADGLRSSPYADHVSALLRQYFNSINARDYDGWAATLSRQRKVDPRSLFLAQYATTVDDDIRVFGISERADGSLLAAVSFRSRQDPSAAPADLPRSCLRWQVGYPLIWEDGRLKIALIGAPNHSYTACAGSF